TLELVGLAAAAARLDVRVLDGEARAHHVVLDEIDLAALEVGGAVPVDDDLHAVSLDHAVVTPRLIFPAELVRHAGAPATHDANPQAPFGLAFLQAQVGHLPRGGLAQRNHWSSLADSGVRGRPLVDFIIEFPRQAGGSPPPATR